MSNKTEFRKKMEILLEQFLNDESKCERYLNTSGTIANWTNEIINDCEDFGLEKEALEYIDAHPDLDILAFGDYMARKYPELEIVDDDADVYED